MKADIRIMTRAACWQLSSPTWHPFLVGRRRCITATPMARGSFRSFSARTSDVIDVRPTEAEQERKREMCEAYSSQGDFLQRFDVARETVRPQIRYDYTRPPHEGKTNYEVWQWSMTAQDVSTAFAELPAIGIQTPSRTPSPAAGG